MGGFLFTTKMEGIQSALDVFSKKGLAVKDEIIGKDFRLFLYEKVNLKTENIIKYSQGDFIVSVGTLIYKDLMGAGALSKLYDDFNTEDEMLDKIENKILGQYCVILRKHGRTYFFNDLAGSYKIFINNTEGTIIASSFLAILAMLNKKTLAKQETYEFIFAGASYGGKTMCHEVSLLDGTSLLIFNDKGELDNRERSINFQLYRKNSDTIQTNVNNMISNLRAYFKVIKNHFDGKIIADLTGGYDTRLMHCLLKDQDIRHTSRVAVPERGGDIDVQCAREIAVGEHIDLIIHEYKDVIKDYKFNKELFLEAHYVLDGIGHEKIIPRGPQICERSKEMSGQFELLLTGAGGENFRAYGGWSQDRPISIKGFLQGPFHVGASYYDYLDINEYYRNLEQKVKASLGISRDYLYPYETEILYQIFRMRYWGGRVDSSYNQFMYHLAPFQDARIAFPAFAVPSRFRKHALLQKKMMVELDARLAAYPSEYDGDAPGRFGHRSRLTTVAHSVRKRVEDYATVHLPLPVKRALRRAFDVKGTRAELPFYLQEDFLETIFGVEEPQISKYIDISKCNSPLILSRCYTLELLLRQSGLD